MDLTPTAPLRRSWLRWLLVALILTVTVPAAAAAPAATDGPIFGLVDGRLLGGNPATVAADLVQDRAIGVTAVRAQLSWNATEPKPGVFEWADFDNLVAQASAAHMTVLGLIVFTPGWARAPACFKWTCPPADPAKFASFARLAAARYGPKVAAWEVWNEPNSPAFWSPQPDPVAYSKLLELTGPAIRAANPTATVVSGGLEPQENGRKSIDAVDFLGRVCDAGGLSAVNAVGDHPYSFPVPPDYPAPWNGWQQMDSTPVSLRSVLAGCGVGNLPIWITEYGAPTNGPGVAASPQNYNLAAQPNHVTPALQAEMVTEAVTDARAAGWIGAVFFYAARDAGTSIMTNQNFFGLSTYNGSHKPAWAALQGALQGG